MKELNLDKCDKIVILAPHPDDEVLGCFSLFSKPEWLEKLIVCYVTDGCFYDYPNVRSQQARSIRKKELEELCENFNIAYHCMNIRDSHTKESKGIFFEQLHKLMKLNGLYSEKTAWFVPHQDERHEDHKCLRGFLSSYFFFHVSEKDRLKHKIYQYEVWTPMTDETYYHKISPARKASAMKSYYPSQLEKMPYIEGILGLNRYRGLQMLVDEHREVFKC